MFLTYDNAGFWHLLFCQPMSVVYDFIKKLSFVKVTNLQVCIYAAM